MGKIIAAIAAALTGNTAVAVASWVASRALIIVALYIVLPYVLYVFQARMMGEIFTFIVGRLDNVTPVPFEKLELAGVLGWFAVTARIPTCINILLTAMQVRWAISFIRTHPTFQDSFKFWCYASLLILRSSCY